MSYKTNVPIQIKYNAWNNIIMNTPRYSLNIIMYENMLRTICISHSL